MAQIMPAPQATPVATPAPIPFKDILPWMVFAAFIAIIFVYFVGVEQGAFHLISGTRVHEFVHDGRHALGFPCH